MRRDILVAIVVVALIGAGVVSYFAYLNRPAPYDSRFSECYRPLGQHTNIGVDVATDEKSFKVTFGGTSTVDPAVDPKVLEQFNACVSLALGNAKFDLEVLTQPTPLGEVLDHWRGSAAYTTSKLVATLSPPLDVSVNNILVTGKGERWSVVKTWCEDPKLRSCLSCQPADVNVATESVALSLNPTGKFKETPLGRAGPPGADPNQAYQPWEDVRDGERYGLLCDAP